jgi:hypothetical protein
MRVIKLSRCLSSLCLCLLLLLITSGSAHAQQAGSLHGFVLDPSGAAIPGASITLTNGGKATSAKSGADGEYIIHNLAAGTYAISVQATGFTLSPDATVSITAGQSRQLNLTLAIAVEQQNVQVNTQASGVSLNPDENSGALVIKGSDLDALSDDPDELQNELQALAGPAAGPNGGEIYIDGFSGGQLPPKSSIREIRVNQNPFSAEFDHIGYGRIEILTKPGTDKFAGHLMSFASDSELNTNNALVPNFPSYYFYALGGDVSGPLSKSSSFFFNFFNFERQTQVAIDATNPNNLSGQLVQAFLTPSSSLNLTPRFDFQLGKSNTVTIRDSFSRSISSGSGVGTLNLASQATNSANYENALQVSDTIVVNSHLINETHFQWRHIRNNSYATVTAPTVTVEGAFTEGGASAGTNTDHEDLLELQNYSTATAGKHTMRFGTRLRSYRDANNSTSGENGSYIFQNIAQYQAGTPSQYQATVISNPLARALLFDAALFYQDDWRKTPGLTISYGLRYEGQNYIHDHADFAPRFAVAWAPHYNSKTPPKTVIRVGYGWFYDRFTVANSFGASSTPYIIQAIHQNGINQQNYVLNNPSNYTPYTPNAPVPVNVLTSSGASTPTITTVDPHFRSALTMQGGIGADRAIGKRTTANVTYLFTRGVHQYLTDVATAPSFDVSNYTITGPTPTVYNNQFQSGGVFSENQVIATVSTRFKKFSVNANYTYSNAKSDTSGATSVPSISQNPGLDYGRASFGITNRIFLLGTWTAPHGIIVAPLLAAQSGTPYNLTIGNDLTGNNQFNARPTYGTCGASGVLTTPFGCLDADPTGKNEQLVPYNLGIGPANVVFHMRISKAIGIGPRIKTETGPQAFNGGGGVQGRGLSGSQQQFKLDASVPRRYNLTFIVGAINIFNIANRGTPNGVLESPLFGQSQTLASGPFGSPSPGNRSVFLQSLFSF